ncbi:TrmH family RNA methyltransferase [Chitinophagaceae bacterium MMS25-I14]
MLSKSQIKYIRSLGQQKYRKEHNVYLAEGEKIAGEWLKSAEKIQMIVGTEQWIATHKLFTDLHPEAEILTARPADLEAVSALQTPNQVLLVVEQPPAAPLPQKEWCIALDTIQDPGNLGTIIRIADWFGINHVVCSEDSAEPFSPKVVQSAMGGHLRVKIHRTDLPAFFERSGMPVIAAALDGANVYEMKAPEYGIILIGNESKGISAELMAKATHKVTIPRRGGAESLNAGVSAGILCALLLPR